MELAGLDHSLLCKSRAIEDLREKLVELVLQIGGNFNDDKVKRLSDELDVAIVEYYKLEKQLGKQLHS